AYARLQRLIEGGAHQHAAEVLRLSAALARRLGPPHHVKGRTTGEPGDEITLFASGLVAYGRTPHPLDVLQAAVAQAQRAPLDT
ncbi:MAG TPA: hypothetical protein VFK80_11340, partial [Limnochordia bacterium]|nr:hypothetical protein [Limnochordia bacterium]